MVLYLMPVVTALLCRLTVLSILVCAGGVQFAYAHHTNKSPESSPDTSKTVVGYVENITVPRIERIVKAKLDTGAKTSSLHAEIIELVEPQDDESGVGYVIFTLETEEGSSSHIKKPLTRMVGIKKKEGGTIRRPVIEMTLCIAGVLITDEVNLSNRDEFNYDALIGRNMLVAGQFIVDAEKQFTERPNCPQTEDTKSTK